MSTPAKAARSFIRLITTGSTQKKEKKRDTDFSSRHDEHGAAGGRSSPTEPEPSLDASTHSRAGATGALVFQDEQGVQEDATLPQGAAPVSARRFHVDADPRLPIQINQAPTSARSVVAFTPRAPRPQLLPPLDVDGARRAVERDAVRSDVQERVISVLSVDNAAANISHNESAVHPVSYALAETGITRVHTVALQVLDSKGINMTVMEPLLASSSRLGGNSILTREISKRLVGVQISTGAVVPWKVDQDILPFHLVAAFALVSKLMTVPMSFTSVYSGYQSRIVQILDLMNGAHDKRGIVYDFMSVIGEHVNATHIWLGTFYWSFKFNPADVARADTFVQKWTDTLFAGMDKQIKLLASTKAFQGIQDHVIRIGMGERMFVPTPYEEVEVE